VAPMHGRQAVEEGEEAVDEGATMGIGQGSHWRAAAARYHGNARQTRQHSLGSPGGAGSTGEARTG
jgi:hypothetical protein